MLSKSDTWILYDGDGEATEFAYPFAVQDAEEVHVYLVGENYKPIELTSDFYVDTEKSVVLYPGYAAGSEPDESEMPAVLASGERILIRRITPCTQLREFVAKYPFNQIELGLDKQTAISQEAFDILNRCLKIASTLHDAGIDVTVPWAADSSFKWSEDGSKLVLMMTTENALILVHQWLEELKEHLETMIKGLEAKLTDLIAEIKSEIETLIADTKAELQANIDTLEAKHDADVVTLQGNIDALEEKHDSDVAEMASRVTSLEEALEGGGTNAVYYGITIPNSGWEIGEDDFYYVDIPLTNLKESMIPVISISAEYQAIATEYRIKATCESYDGYLRLHAEYAVEEEIPAKIILIGVTDTLVEELESQAKTETDEAIASLEEKHDSDVASLTEQLEALDAEIDTVAASISDTKVTNTLATTTKAYVTATTSGSTNTGTQVFDTGVYLGTTAGSLYATTFVGDLDGNAATATTATTAGKIGSSTVGSGVKPVYLSSGTVTASGSTVGSSAIPAYLASGVLTACGYNLSTMQAAIEALESKEDGLSVSASTLASTGYLKLSNGFTLQWGLAAGGTTKPYKVTFPATFTAIYGVMINPAKIVTTAYTTNVTASYFQVGGDDGTDQNYAPDVYWFAYGYIA